MGFKPPMVQSSGVWDRGWPESTDEFEELVETYLDRLVLAAFRRLGNIHDAEDVVQDVFVRAFSERPKRKVSHVEPYLFRMVINACTDLLRKRKRFVFSSDAIETDTIPDGQTNPADTIAAVREIRRVDILLQRLPKKQAEVIRLRVFDELRLSEIAEIVGCSIDTVNSRLRYGFKKLRKIIAREVNTV